MKLPSLRQSTDQKREAAIAARAAAEQRLAVLEEEHRGALEGDEVDGLHKLHAGMAQQRMVIGDLSERIIILDERKRREDAEQREAEHQRALRRFEATLPPIAVAAKKLEDAVAGVAAAARELEAAGDAARRAWPPGVVAWGAFHLDGGRAGELVKSCFSPGGLWRRHGERVIAGPTGDEFFAKALSADERATGFAQLEQEHHASLVADLRAAPVPHPEPLPVVLDDEQDAAA
jgi:hypothetical protein